MTSKIWKVDRSLERKKKSEENPDPRQFLFSCTPVLFVALICICSDSARLWNPYTNG